MKKLITLICSVIPFLSPAQSVMPPVTNSDAATIVENYTKYMGGLDAFLKVQTAKMTGVATVQGMDLPLTMQIINGKAMRTDVDVNGQAVVNVYHEGKGWKINPFAGAETATDVSGLELQEFRSQANLASSLMDYKNQGNNIERVSEETVEGIPCDKIKLTIREDGREVFYFISKKDNSLIKSTATREMMGQKAEVETLYSDLKEFAGLKFFMTRTQSVSGQVFQVISLSNVELNVPVDEKIFEK